MSRTNGIIRRPLSKSTTRHRARALPLGVALLLFASALAPRPATAGLLDDLWAGLRFLWTEQGWQIDPNGRPAAEPPAGASALWAEAGWELDPSGLVTPPPFGEASALWAEQGWELDPSGLVSPPTAPADTPDHR